MEEQVSAGASGQSRAPAPTGKNGYAARGIGPKPLLRGWFHAGAAVAAVVLTVALAWLSRDDWPKLVSMVVFGLAMVELYTVSAVYHIGSWRDKPYRVLRALDHSNIFVVIAGTYTPLCLNILSGWGRVAMLVSIWVLALAGIALSVVTIGVAGLKLEVPRWVSTALYIAMGWVAIFALPAYLAVLPWTAVGLLFFGGALYTVGAVVYAKKWPNPFPRVFGFHEIFHLFVIAGGAVFAVVVWVWALPFPRA